MADITFTYNVTLKNGRRYSFSEKTTDTSVQNYRGWHGINWLKSFVSESIENVTSRPDIPFNETDIKEISFNFTGFNS